MAHPELAAEQAYVDNAYTALDKMRTTLEGAQDRVATEFAAVAMEAWLKRRHKTFQDAERGLCFGRLTLDGTLRPLYIGRRWVHDDAHEMLVVNWQAPAARPFYTATPSEPQRVTQRRRFRTDARRVVDISDESLDGSAVEGATVSDFLLEELDRRREGRMRDIVATIQSDQYRLITAEPEGALVVQGGPGTGKTAVGLHRASWLLFTHREQLRRVLVVGPNPTFMDYVSHVLPALGEEAVEQRAVSELLDGIVVEREEAMDVAALKADPRLSEVVQRAVELSVRPAPEELVLYADGVFVSVKERDVRPLLDAALEDGAALQLARERFRMAVLRRFYERYGELLGPRALRSFEELEGALRRNGFLTKYLDRVLPLPRAEKLVARLLTSPSALAEAAGELLDRGEQRLLLRDRPRRVSELQWSAHDLPLLDVARTLIEGPARAYGHVIVDEAQDLSPMQLLMVSRRAVDGSLTMLGDVAQATGPVTYGRWQELEPYLPEDINVRIEELRHAYRVPAEIMELALPLLDRIAPGVEPPLAYRQGGSPPKLVRVGADELLAAAAREAAVFDDGLLAIIGPRSLVESEVLEDTFLLTPPQAKGLEFDHVVVIEPALIVEEGGERGLRELYVALTRPTKTLVVVHSREWQ
jgi:DNA helicase IV